MKKSFYTLMACVGLSLLGGQAHAASLDLGLCEGQMSQTGVSKTGSGTIEVALVLPASEFQMYKGASLSGLRVGLNMVDGISNVKGWVRTSFDGENLCTASFTAAQAGWNEMQFDAPCDYLLSDQDLVIGYQFEQSKSTKCISLAGRKSDDCYWLARNGSWQNLSASASGAVSVELVIEGDMVPACNLSIESCHYSPLVPYGEPFTAQIVVRNMAKATVNGYRCLYQTGMIDVLDVIDRHDVVLGYRDRDTVQLVVPGDVQTPDEVRYSMPFYIEAEGDEITDDNKCNIYRSNYTASFPHLLLMEEFTTEECANCPRAINTLAQMVNEGKEFAQISHHVGYNTDYLTVDEDKNYLWFYGDEGSFAPAGMFNRTYDPDYYTAGSGSGGYPIFSIGYAETFRPAIEKAMALPAFVRLTPTLQFDETSRQLAIDVDIEKAHALDALTSEPRLSVVLIEDSLPAQHQAGISSTTFRHRHVYRKCLTDLWGDALTFDGNTCTKHLEYTLPDDWDAKHVEVVAFVNDYNPSDRNDCKVYNTATAGIGHEEESAIRNVRMDHGTSPILYNLMGQPVKAGRHQTGIYISAK